MAGTVGGLICHHKRSNPNAVHALEQRLHAEGRLPVTADEHDSSLDRNGNHLTLEDQEALEAGATIRFAPTQP